jgi:hypothetical protein
MATKRASGEIIEGPITVKELLGLAEAAQMLQAMLIDALATLDPRLEVEVSAAWLRRYSRLGGIRIGKGCDCAGRAAMKGVKNGPKLAARGITIGKAC